jgi:type IV secretion system protein VirD4
VVTAGRYADAPPARPDDWSGLAIPAVPVVSATASVDDQVGGTDDGGPRRQPELSEAIAYDPEPEHMPSDLSLLDDDDLWPLPRQLDPAMQRTARLASLNPNDGIDL